MMVMEQTPFSIRNIFESLQVMLQQKAEQKKPCFKFHVDKAIPDFVMVIRPG